ncbi:hypothetical protein C8Q80DRAFT_1121122 [Daedaleopsis nitida]|nr:hypothetical protein C8Q80DRAFT_1121122 [Daedaleopsis nitida]
MFPVGNIIVADLQDAVLEKLLKPEVESDHSPPLPSEDNAFVDSLVTTIRISCAKELREIENIATRNGSVEAALYDQSVTLRSIRRSPEDDVSEVRPAEVNQVEDTNLYRISLSDFGKPLWKYKSGLEFVRVMYQAIKAHEILSKNGVLHRVISVDNIPIRVNAELDVDNPSPDPSRPRDPDTAHITSKDVTAQDTTTSYKTAAILDYDYAEEHAEGLLTDFEYASIGSETSSSKASSETSDGMSGMPLFMATELLEAIVHKKSVAHTATFDLESFGYTIVHAIYRNTLNSETLPEEDPVRDAVEREFESLFGFTLSQGLYAKRLQAFWAYSIDPEKKGAALHAIYHLHNHIPNNCVILAEVLASVWQYIKMMQPKAPQIRPPTDPISARFYAATSKYSDPPVVSIEVTHEMILEILEIALDVLGDAGAGSSSRG